MSHQAAARAVPISLKPRCGVAYAKLGCGSDLDRNPSLRSHGVAVSDQLNGLLHVQQAPQASETVPDLSHSGYSAGDMKPSASQDKNQRSIASFFFKPKTGATPKTGPSKQQRVLGEKQAAQGPPLLAPGKRQRVLPPETQRQEDALPPVKASTPSCQTKAASLSAVQPLAAANVDPEPAQASRGSSIQPSDNTHTLQTQVPARIEHRHQRFQRKLVVGAGNKPEGQAKGMPAVTKPKYTPLELQIVELKDKHPGVLLIVEVTKPPGCTLHCTQHLLTSGKAA